MFSYTYTNLINLFGFVKNIGRGYFAHILVMFAVLYFVLPITMADDRLTIKLDAGKGLSVPLFDGKSISDKESLILNNGNKVTVFLNDKNQHQIFTVRNIDKGVVDYVPTVRIVVGNKTYLADARHIYLPDNTSVFKKYENKYIGDVNEDLKKTNAGTVTEFPKTVGRYITEATSTELATSKRPKPKPEGLVPGADVAATEGADAAVAAEKVTPRDTTNSLGVDLMAELNGNTTPAEKPAEVAPTTTAEETAAAAEDLSKTRPKTRPETAEIAKGIPIPPMNPRSVSEEALRDGLLLSNNKALSKTLVVTRKEADGSVVSSVSEEEFKLPKNSTLRAVYMEKPVKRNGVDYQEVEYVDQASRSYKRLLVPMNELVDSEGNTLKSDSILTISGTAKKKREDAKLKAAVDSALSERDQAAAKKKADEEAAATAAKKKADEAAAVAAKKKADEEAAAKAQGPATCSNPKYFETLTSSNPNCSLVKSPALVRSTIKKGDAVIAMDKNSKACYKISVDTTEYVNDTAIESYVKARKDVFDQIGSDLQKKNAGFISQGQADKNANRYNMNCFDRLSQKRCNFSFGTGSDYTMKLHSSLTLPTNGYKVDAAKDSKLEIYGPSSEGFYIVRHLKGNSFGRAFLVEDPNAIKNAVKAMKDFEGEFNAEQFNKMLARNPKTFTKELPVLDVQKMDSNGKVKNEMIYLDPKQPFAKLAEYNKKYDYYSISCTESFNPLKPQQQKDSGVVDSREPRTEKAVLRGVVPRAARSEAIDI